MIRRSTNEILIKPRINTSTKVVVCGLGGILICVLIYGAYALGVRSGHSQFERDAKMLVDNSARIAELEQQLETAQIQLDVGQRKQKVQAQAYTQLNRAFSNAEEKNQALEQTLGLYRSIISPASGESGPSIHSFDYRWDNKLMLFDVTLVQAILHKDQVRGRLKVQLFDQDVLLQEWPRSAMQPTTYQYFSKRSGEFDLSKSESELGVFESDELSVVVTLLLNSGEPIVRRFAVVIPQDL